MAALRFHDAGVVVQMVIETPDDLARIGEVDEARWTATSAPVEQLYCDPAFLTYLDTDKNGRVRVVEMKEAVRWLWGRLRDRSRVVERTDALRLDDLDPDDGEARKVRALAERLLARVDDAERGVIKLEQVRRFKAGYTSRFPNGDGVVAPSQIVDPDAKAAAEEIARSTGGRKDLSDEVGVGAPDVALWRERLEKLVAWTKRAESEKDALFPLGDETAACAALIDELEPKVAQFFAQCALVAIEENARGRLSASPDELKGLDVKDPAAIEAWLRSAPLARPNVEGVLPLDGAVNPGFAAPLAKLARDVGPKVLGRAAPLTALTQADWSALVAKLAAHRAWRAARPAGLPDGMTREDAEARLASPALAKLTALIAEDEGVAAELVEFTNLEKLILYQRWLFELANNFVAIPHLFRPGARTLFEAGTLVLDGRRFNLCVKVVGKDAHMKAASSSEMFLVYVEIARRDGERELKDLVATAVTSGVRGGIAVGKRGVFYDREGVEWDALVVGVVENPISIVEAAVAPFVRLKGFVGDRIAKIAGTKAQALEAKATEVASKDPPVAGAAAPPAPPPPAAPPAAPPSAAGLQALVVGGSVAFAAIGTSLAFIVKTFTDIDPLRALVSCFVLAAALATASGFLGWLKLRRRDVAALLEACGWALNTRMRLRRPLTTIYTRRPPLPPGAIVRRAGAGLLVVGVVALIVALLAGAFVQGELWRAFSR